MTLAADHDGIAVLIGDESSQCVRDVVCARGANGDEALIAIRKLGTTIVVVEQDASLALSIADRAYIMQRGQIERSAPSAILKNDAAIQRDYLGERQTK